MFVLLPHHRVDITDGPPEPAPKRTLTCKPFVIGRGPPDVTLDLVPHTCGKNSLQGPTAPETHDHSLAQ
jgi:hypothetical protein